MIPINERLIHPFNYLLFFLLSIYIYCNIYSSFHVLVFLLYSWYHDNLTRQQAEDMLKRMRKDGYFLVRKKATGIDGDAESYAISFR